MFSLGEIIQAQLSSDETVLYLSGTGDELTIVNVTQVDKPQLIGTLVGSKNWITIVTKLIINSANGWAVNAPPNSTNLIFTGIWTFSGINLINVSTLSVPTKVTTFQTNGFVYNLISVSKYPNNLFASADIEGVLILGNYSNPESSFIQSKIKGPGTLTSSPHFLILHIRNGICN